MTPARLRAGSIKIIFTVRIPKMTMTATYSPEDNKLRLYAASRLDAETYKTVKDAGFIWAPKQGFFVAPMWTPAREDFLMKLCGEVGDEDTSLVERAEERADRFTDYSDKRASEADTARKAVGAIAENIPFGQPILVGHHSERRARKDAERIENGMRRAVQLWDTSDYWKQRAEGALRHAKYKELPAVRARRIKTLEADKRKQERARQQAEMWLKLWTECANEKDAALQSAVALRIAGACWLHLPRKEGDREDWSHTPTAYDALTGAHPTLYAPRTLDEIIGTALRVYPYTIKHCDRWIKHYENRIAYERAMLDEAGGTVAEQKGPQKGGACRCWASPRGGWSYIQKVNKVTVTVLDNWGNGGKNFTRTIPFDKLTAIMTAAEVEEKRTAGLLVETSDKTGFILREAPTDETREETKEEQNDRLHREHMEGIEAKGEGKDAAAFEAMREQLRAGVKVVSAPQLFLTPVNLAARMAGLAEIEPGHRIADFSAGTGRLLAAVLNVLGEHVVNGRSVHAVEYNMELAGQLIKAFPLVNVWCMDFLAMSPGDFEPVDRILLNPPFADGADIKHIKHAMRFLKSGGRMVAICANGPRQNDQLRPLVDAWEDLPAGTFAESGTNVNTALVIYTKP